MEEMHKVAVVVSSCDAFEDCWYPFLKSFNDCWNDCPYEVFIITNEKSINTSFSKVHTLNVGEDGKWGSNMLKALEMIEAEWIFYLQEDYFLENKISSTIMQGHVDYCKKNDIDYLRLSYPFLESNSLMKPYYENSFLERYSVCLQAALWKKNSFKRCIVDGWSGWDFEHNIVNHLSKNMPSFKVIGISRSEWLLYGFKYVDGTAVRKGRWTRAAVKYLRNNGFGFLVNKRPIEGYLLSFFQENRTLPSFVCATMAKIMNKFKWNF